MAGRRFRQFGLEDHFILLESLEHWYAVRVRPRHEKSVFAQLVSKEHDTFLPLYSARNKWADRWKTLSLPLFPGYVFCRFDLSERRSVLTSFGVIDLVRTGPSPAPVANSQLEAIRAAVGSSLVVEPWSGLAQGDRVIMTSGPLKGLTGRLLEVRKGLRLVLSVDLLHRSVVVEIDREWVARME